MQVTVRERINADRATVLRLVAEVELWPALFPHLRSARLLQQAGARRLIELRTGWLRPGRRWRALQTLDEAAGTVTFQVGRRPGHPSSVTWQIAPIADTADPACEVTVACSERSGSALALGPVMLARVREIAEGGSLAGRD
jgi:hypothetical protein